MSVFLLTTAPSAFSSTYEPHRSNNLPTTKTRPSIVTLNKHRFIHRDTTCEQKQMAEGEDRWIAHRRNALVGLGVLTGAAAGLGSLSQGIIMAVGAPEKGSSSSQTQPLFEFGSQPLLLKSTVRVLVPRSKRSHESKKGNLVEIVVIDGIEIPNDEPVRLDVYVGKPNGDKVGPDFGEFAGSLVDLARIRVGRIVRKGSLELGITGLVKDIGANDCDKLVVTLVPKTGHMFVEGVRIRLEHTE